MAATQLIAFRTASVGREALARVQARWAARAGIEESLAVIEYHTENPDPEDQLTIYKDLEDEKRSIVHGWRGRSEVAAVVDAAIKRYHPPSDR